MRGATPELRGLARRLLAREASGHRDPPHAVAAAEAVFQKLGEPVRRIIGGAGFQSLLARSVNLSASEFPLLQTLQGEALNEDFLRRLRAALPGREPTETAEAMAAVLANFVWLLVTFVGPDLALRLVREVWPDLSLEDLERGSSEVDR